MESLTLLLNREMFIKKSKRPTLNIRNRQDDEEGDERPTKRIVKKSIVFSSLDDEEEGEIFKVKKSKVSKLMSRVNSIIS